MFRFGIFISLFLLTAVFVSGQKPDPDFTDKIAKQEQERFVLKSAFQESKDYSDYDLIYQQMNWLIDPNVRYISGSIKSKFISQVSDLNKIQFDFNSSMTVDSVVQQNKKIEFELRENKLTVFLNNSLQNQESDSVEVFYQGVPEPETNGFPSFSITYHDSVPNLWTLSEPYGAMEWWPCKQSLIDKIDSIDILVTCPDSYRTASNGILVSESVENGFRKMHWKHRYPIATYLVAISVTNYAVYSDWADLQNNRQLEILNYVYPENLELAKTQTPLTAEFIRLYNQLFGEYPFAKEKYGHAQFGWGGGMEHQTMSFMAKFNYELVAHELAHQWFGDYITCGSWHDIWLNEGFATYLTGLTYENLEDGYWWPIWKKVNLNKIVEEHGGSVYVQDTTDVSTIFSSRLSYSKGAFLLHMLRWILGDKDFFAGMRSYFNDPELANSFALTSQFVKQMETAGDTTLTEFFNDWFYGQGYPIYSSEYKNTGGGIYTITLSQTTSHPSVSFFEMPVPVRFYGNRGIDSVDFRLIHTHNNQEFNVKVGFPVDSMKIDPDYWLVSKTSQITGTTAEKGLVVYPNPFTENISVLPPVGTKISTTRLFSATGKLIKQVTGNKNKFIWTDVTSGLYFIQIETDKGIFEEKIVKY